MKFASIAAAHILNRFAERRDTALSVFGALLICAVCISNNILPVVAASTPRHSSTSSWRVSKSLPPALTSVTDLSCPTGTHCYGLATYGISSFTGNGFASTTNFGSSWNITSLPSGFSLISQDQQSQAVPGEALACPVAGTCLIPGTTSTSPAVAETTNGGATWHVMLLPKRFAGMFLSAISCRTVSSCLGIVNGTVVATTNGGGSWKASNIKANFVVCSQSGVCAAVGQSLFLSVDGGVIWKTRTLPPHNAAVTYVTCPTSSSCFAAALGAVWITTNGGTSWHSSPHLTNLAISGLSCGTPLVCEAVAGDSTASAGIWKTSNAGKNWKAQTVPRVHIGATTAPTSLVQLKSVVCLGSNTCLIGGNASGRFISSYPFGFVLTTTRGGQTWKQQPFPQGSDGMAAISCASTVDCEAVGGTLFVGTSHGGSSWTTNNEMIPMSGSDYPGFGAIACASRTDCEALGGTVQDSRCGTCANGVIAGTTDGGATWKAKSIPSSFELSGIACPSTSDCFAVGFASSLSGPTLLRTTNGGKKWTSLPPPSGLGRLTAISCASTKFCESVGDASAGGPAIIGTSNGSTWKTQHLPAKLPANSFLGAITCPTTKVCQVAGGSLGVGGLMLGTLTGGSTWRTEPIPGGVGTLSAVVCSGTAICHAVGTSASSASGAALGSTKGGAKWTRATLPAGIQIMSGLACPSVSVCYAAATSVQATGLILKLG